MYICIYIYIHICVWVNDLPAPGCFSTILCFPKANTFTKSDTRSTRGLHHFWVHARSTQGLHKVYTRSTPFLDPRKVYTRFTQGLHEVYTISGSTQGLHKVYTRSTRGLHNPSITSGNNVVRVGIRTT